jgi:hypothetical protein
LRFAPLILQLACQRPDLGSTASGLFVSMKMAIADRMISMRDAFPALLIRISSPICVPVISTNLPVHACCPPIYPHWHTSPLEIPKSAPVHVIGIASAIIIDHYVALS